VETGLDASAAGTLGLVVFLVLKTVADLIVHPVEHALERTMWLSPSGWAIMWPAPQVGPASRRDRDEWKRFTLSWGSGPTMC
jgi:hypothetical protein